MCPALEFNSVELRNKLDMLSAIALGHKSETCWQTVVVVQRNCDALDSTEFRMRFGDNFVQEALQFDGGGISSWASGHLNMAGKDFILCVAFNFFALRLISYYFLFDLLIFL